MPKTYALADCNNFYVSCERAFNPALEGKPVAVLSNNDGCVVSRSQEAKDLGVKMGVPYFEVKGWAEGAGLVALSSNYALYADLSARVMSILSELAPGIEIYSIDECFLDLSGLERGRMRAFGLAAREKVLRWTGIPIGIGIAPTKTLAKLANHMAKMDKSSGGVVELLDGNAISAALQAAPAKAIWGVGSKSSEKLARQGIRSAKELRDAPDEALKRLLGVTGLRTAMELRGLDCVSGEAGGDERKTVTCSRSFGRAVESLEEIEQAIATYAEKAAEKLRAMKLAASTLSVFMETNRFIEDASMRHNGWQAGSFQQPTSSGGAIVPLALALARKAYKPGYVYKRAGVALFGIVPEGAVEPSLFIQEDKAASPELDKAIDKIRSRFGGASIVRAAEGLKKPWAMKRERMSPNYTTAWDSLPQAK